MKFTQRERKTEPQTGTKELEQKVFYPANPVYSVFLRPRWLNSSATSQRIDSSQKKIFEILF
jgi:hypothetical protein